MSEFGIGVRFRKKHWILVEILNFGDKIKATKVLENQFLMSRKRVRDEFCRNGRYRIS